MRPKAQVYGVKRQRDVGVLFLIQDPGKYLSEGKKKSRRK